MKEKMHAKRQSRRQASVRKDAFDEEMTGSRPKEALAVSIKEGEGSKTWQNARFQTESSEVVHRSLSWKSPSMQSSHSKSRSGRLRIKPQFTQFGTEVKKELKPAFYSRLQHPI
jgi:hypothetical protein